MVPHSLAASRLFFALWGFSLLTLLLLFQGQYNCCSLPWNALPVTPCPAHLYSAAEAVPSHPSKSGPCYYPLPRPVLSLTALTMVQGGHALCMWGRVLCGGGSVHTCVCLSHWALDCEGFRAGLFCSQMSGLRLAHGCHMGSGWSSSRREEHQLPP